MAAAPEAFRSSSWLAPEIINPARNMNGTPVLESKPADVFAFGMLAVEVFAGEMPFGGQTNAVVALYILRGHRPEMPENAQAVGLTREIWKLLQRCWHRNPEKRPTMEEIVKRWEKFVENSSDDSTPVPECV